MWSNDVARNAARGDVLHMLSLTAPDAEPVWRIQASHLELK